MRITGAGVLLTDLDRFVAGFELANGRWSEFGGERDKGETVWQTAKRELYEESACLFTLDNEPEWYVDREYKPGKVYRCYIAVTKLDSRWPQYFQENLKEQTKPHFKEMDKLRFFRIDDRRSSFSMRFWIIFNLEESDKELNVSHRCAWCVTFLTSPDIVIVCRVPIQTKIKVCDV